MPSRTPDAADGGRDGQAARSSLLICSTDLRGSILAIKASLLSVTAAGLGFVAAACGPEPPVLVSLEVWEGYLANAGLAVLQRRVEPMTNGSFVLRRNTAYVARITLRTSGTEKRCLFTPFSYSWALPSREYSCYPEVDDGPMTIDVPFATWDSDLARTSDYYMTVRVSENGPDRQSVATYDTRRYPVEFSG
jgi:hypothetical protein